MDPPEEEEIVAKWQAVIPKHELEILKRYAPPSPVECIERGEEWTFLGKIREWHVWMIRRLFGKHAGIATIVVTVIGLVEGIGRYGPPIVKWAADIPKFEQSIVAFQKPENPKYIVFQPQEIKAPYFEETHSWDVLLPNTMVSGLSAQSPFARG